MKVREHGRICALVLFLLYCYDVQTTRRMYFSRFSTHGCTALDSDNTSALCSCSHMTNYALLMQIGPQETYDRRGIILIWLTRVVFALSLVCLFITGCVLLYVRYVNFQYEFVQVLKIFH